MIRIIVDSSADYSLAEIEKKQMTLVSLNISLGEKTYQDGFDISRDQLYEWLIESGDFPKTAQPSPETFLKHFEEAKAAGDDVICILLSSALSGTCQSAHLAKNMADYDNIHIIDSLAATHLIRFLANKACAMRDAGHTAEEIVAAVEELKGRIKVIAAVDTLEYLCRGGRVSRAAAAIGNMANLKPIITVTPEGEVSVIGKCMGKNKSMSFIVNAAQEYEIDENYPIYSIYSYGQENCISLEAKLVSSGYTLRSRKQLGATIGCHVGPGAFGVLFVRK